MFEEGYKVKPMSIKEIRHLTDRVRSFFNIDPRKAFPILPFIENVVPEYVEGFTFAILEDDDFEESIFTDFNPIEKQLRCRESVYQKAFEGDGASRGHLCHELGHIFLHRNQGAVLTRGFMGSRRHAKYEDSEWQASTFERELLIPFGQLTTEMTTDEIAKRYETSEQLASISLDRYHKSLIEKTSCSR